MFSVGNNGALSAIAASAVVNHRKTILGFCAVDIDVQTPAEVPPVARVHRSIDSLHEQNHKLPSSHAPPSIFFSPSSMWQLKKRTLLWRVYPSANGEVGIVVEVW